jgi:transposase
VLNPPLLRPISSSSALLFLAPALCCAQLSEQMKWHELKDIETVEKRHYEKAGKPRPEDVPQRISYRVTATVKPVEEEIAAQRRRCGRFILANVLEQLSMDDLIREYKAQQGTERGFRFLKDPLFFASSVFLKSRERIEALGMIMALCLLVYNLG